MDEETDSGPAPGEDGDGSDAGPSGMVGMDAEDAPQDSGATADGAPQEGGASCTCVGAAPTSWQGYVQLVWSDAGAACASPYAAARGSFIGGVGDAGAECSPCACSVPPSGPITCEVQLGSGGALCSSETLTLAPQGVCVLPPGPMGLTSGPNGDAYGPTATPAPVGTCTPTGGTLTRPLAPTTPATVCGVVDAGVIAACGGSGHVCVPPPAPQSSSTATNVCIYRSGVQTCPDPYTVQHVVSTGLTDDRACSSCSCAAPACPSDGFVQGYTSLNCTGSVAVTFDAGTPCTLGDNANLSVSFMYTPSHSAWNGTCAASGGVPTGGVTLAAQDATTYCCLP